MKKKRFARLTPYQLEVLLDGAKYMPCKRSKWGPRSGMAWFTQQGRLCTDQVWALRHRRLLRVTQQGSTLTLLHIFIPKGRKR